MSIVGSVCKSMHDSRFEREQKIYSVSLRSKGRDNDMGSMILRLVRFAFQRLEFAEDLDVN